MPEGDTVWLAGRRLHEALSGRVMTRSDFRVPRLATTDLTKRTVENVVSRGKHLLIRIEGGLTLHTHFKMDGSWHLYRRGERWRGGPEWQVRAVLENDEWQAVGYRLPVIELLSTSAEDTVVGHLGPDLLGADWDPDEAVRRLAADPDREIGEAILDQRIMAGAGNVYKTEVCFLRGLSPWTSVRDVGDLRAIVDLTHRLLVANKQSYLQVTTGDTRRGQWHYVFERQGKPCRRCGTKILVTEQGQPSRQRLSYWCPRCQPGQAPEPTRRRDVPPPRIVRHTYTP
jgi:endonuclease VIII